MTGEEELEKIADKFLDCGIGHVVIKTGKKGCYIKSQDKTVMEAIVIFHKLPLRFVTNVRSPSAVTRPTLMEVSIPSLILTPE